jgi:molybdopterin-guanine dinucleotide biosynthesis protein B
MRIFGLAGWSGSGKTSLVVRLLPVLMSRGVSVSTLKHAHHAFDVDQPGKDSWEHRAAGALEVMVSSANRWALMHEHRGEPEASLEELIARMSPVDLVIVEGFKSHPHPKLEVHRAALDKPLLCHDDPFIIAVAGDSKIAGLPVPFLALDDTAAIVDFIVAHCHLKVA